LKEGWREGGREGGKGGWVEKKYSWEVGTYGSQNDGLDVLETMVREGGTEEREGGREGGLTFGSGMALYFLAARA